MKLSLSCRIAEGFLSKEEANMSFLEFAKLAKAAGYDAVCMRASQIGVQSPDAAVREARAILDDVELSVSMITGDFDIVYNNERGPACLRNIEPYVELAATLRAPLIRVCVKEQADLAHLRSAADLAGQRGIRLVHQCHIQSLFETVEQIEAVTREIDHANFGLIFEAANLEQCGQAYGVETIERLSPWLANVYVQNQRIHSEGAIELDTWCRGPVRFDVCEIPEHGGLDFASIIQGLKACHYAGYVTVHQSAPESDDLSTLDAAKQTAAFLKGLAAKDA